MIEAQQSAQTVPAYDRSGPVEVGGRRDELAAQPLMVALLVVMREVLADQRRAAPLMVSLAIAVRQILADRGAQVPFAEKHVARPAFHQVRQWKPEAFPPGDRVRWSSPPVGSELEAADLITVLDPNGSPAHRAVCPFSRYLPTSSVPLVSGFPPMREDGWLPTS
jgi:hypothetical protein